MSEQGTQANLVTSVATVETLAPAADGVTRIILVRHGVTTWNAEDRYQGRADVPLSNEGCAQALALADRLRGVPIDAAYTSPLRRARATAEAILAGRGVRAMPEERLMELSYGGIQGRRRAEWLAESPHEVAAWESSPWTVTFAEGESLDDVYRRAIPIWERLVAVHQGDTVLVSAHGHVNRVLLLHALGLERDAFWTVPQPNAGCVVVDADARQASALLVAS